MSVSAAAAEELRAFFARVRPDYRELFNMAHAICGNYETAEYAVQSAILQIYRGAGPVKSRMGLRESLRGAVRREAVSQTLLIGETELTWDGFCPDAIDGAQGDFILPGRRARGRRRPAHADAALRLRPAHAGNRAPDRHDARAGRGRVHAL